MSANNGSISNSSPGAQAPNRLIAQARESNEARVVGMRIHTAEVALGRVPDQQWSLLTPLERTFYDARGALALRLLDPVKLAVAREDAVKAVYAMHDDTLPSLEVARAITQQAIATFVASLSGQKAGR